MCDPRRFLPEERGSLSQLTGPIGARKCTFMVVRNAPRGYPQIIPNNPPVAVLVGASRLTYQFQVHPIPTTYKRLAGLYVVFRLDGPDQLSVLYVGETHDFNERVGDGRLSHHKWPRIVRARATHIGTLVIAGDHNQRLAREADIVQAYNPPPNDRSQPWYPTRRCRLNSQRPFAPRTGV